MPILPHRGLISHFSKPRICQQHYNSVQIHLYIKFLIKAGNDCTLALQIKSLALHHLGFFQQDPHTIIVCNLKLT